jgi:hypothetical protein
MSYQINQSRLSTTLTNPDAVLLSRAGSGIIASCVPSRNSTGT